MNPPNAPPPGVYRANHSRQRMLGAIVKTILCAGVALNAPPTIADYQSGLRAHTEQAWGLAFDEWEGCAIAGDANCQYALGVLHDEGRAVKPDIYAALQWYERAARQAHPDAMMQLGFLYATGRGDIVQSAILAWVWFSRAAAHGVDQAATYRDRIGDLLDVDEMADAQRRADQLSFEYHQQVQPQGEPQTESEAGTADKHLPETATE